MSASPGPVRPPAAPERPDPEGEGDGPRGEGGRRAPPPAAGSRRGGGLSGVGALVSELFSERPGTAALAVLLLLAGNITEGFSLLALIPLLHAAGFGDGEAEGVVFRTAASLSDAFGVTLTLPAALGLFVGLIGLRAAATWQREVVFARVKLAALDRLRERLHRAMAAAPWRFLAARAEADFRHVLTGDVRRVGAAFGHFLHVSVAVTVAVTHLAVVLLVSAPTAGAILAAGLALFWMTRPLLRRSGTLGGEITGANRVIYAQVQDFLAGLKFAKSHAVEGAHVAHLSAAVAALRQRLLASAATGALALAAVQFAAAVVLAAAGWFVLVQADLPLPVLAAVVVLSARTMTVLVGVQRRSHELANTLPAFRHAWSVLADLEAAAEERAEERPPAPSEGGRNAAPDSAGRRRGEVGPMVLARRLSVRGVSFDYLRDPGTNADRETARFGDAGSGNRGREDSAPSGPTDRSTPPEGGRKGVGGGALREIDLDIPRGEFLVLSGPSGAGKTTLADLLVGLMPPTTGRISVDGVALDAGNRRRWRASCALLSARPYLFPGRIRANLAWGREDAGEEEMRRALEAAAAADFVFRLAGGLDAEIGDGGAGLSAGERQRLAFARALLRRPTLLVLDEATSQLDEANESRVLETLRSLRGRTTVVATTHSAGFLTAADRVVRIEAGRSLAPEAPGAQPGGPLRARPAAPSVRLG